MSRRGKWLLSAGIVAAIGAIALFVAAILISRNFEPYIRQQTIEYLEQRFDSQVELTALRVRVPPLAALSLLRPGSERLVTVEGEGLSIRHRGRQDVPPLFVLRKFAASIGSRTLFGDPKTVPLVTLNGMEINIPPKGERPKFGGESKPPAAELPEKKSGVVIQRVDIHNAKLAILPKDPSKIPLRFNLLNVQLESAGKDVAMKYDAVLTNPKPPGEIHSNGTFGPWAAGEPSETPLAGSYLFENADLAVFKGIAGILRSTGEFEGRLEAIAVRGAASVPDFRLTRSGNAVSLTTKFEVLVDGTNGNTTLKPVQATLGETKFATSGAIIKHEGERRRAITLDVSMPNGRMRDVLTLAMKGAPFMEGALELHTQIAIPPVTGKVKERLLLDGRFNVTNGKFLRSKIQDQVDGLSRRGQGAPKNLEIDEVVSRMTGSFNLENEVITFKTLAFAVSGAAVNLTGNYDIDRDQLDFRGALMLDAKVSQTMSGWKRWVLKPADPFFSKHGAGTFLKIKILGTAKEPKFGRDR
ncbi:MAG: hypothetical protein WD696_06230 [Bryobacteraceae bacterium]